MKHLQKKKHNTIHVAILTIILSCSASPAFAKALPGVIPATFTAIGIVIWSSVYIWLFKFKNTNFSLKRDIFINVLSAIIVTVVFTIMMLVTMNFNGDFSAITFFLLPFISAIISKRIFSSIYRNEYSTNILKEIKRTVSLMVIFFFSIVMLDMFSLSYLCHLILIFFIFSPLLIIRVRKKKNLDQRCHYNDLFLPALMSPLIANSPNFIYIFAIVVNG